MIPARTLNRRVTIQQRDTGTDAAGQPLQTWSDVVTVWANIASVTGLSAIRDMQGALSASVSRFSIRIRYRDGIDAGMRALYGSQVFDIKGVLPDFAGHEYVDLVCDLGNG